MIKNKQLQLNDFGKDHFSLLAYIETRMVDYQVREGVGELDRDHMRCHPQRHPMLMGRRVAMAEIDWEPSFGTRLSGYWDSNGKIDKSRRLDDHDDWDCLEDLEEAGLIEIVSLVNGFVKMTECGQKIASLVRQHKSNSGSFATFKLEDFS